MTLRPDTRETADRLRAHVVGEPDDRARALADVTTPLATLIRNPSPVRWVVVDVDDGEMDLRRCPAALCNQRVDRGVGASGGLRRSCGCAHAHRDIHTNALRCLFDADQ